MYFPIIDVLKEISDLKSDLNFVTPEMFGAKGDGVTDDTEAIRNAVNSGFKLVIFSPKTYLLDPQSFVSYTGYSTKIGIPIPSNTTLIGNGARLLVKQSTLGTTCAILATDNYRSASYDANLPWQYNVNIKGFTIDGNSANGENAYSLTGIAINKTNNVNIENITITNMCGTDGSGYGVIFAFSNRILFQNSSIDRSSRSNVYCWESQYVLVKNCKFGGGYLRDCVTNSSNVPIALQKSIITYDNCNFIHNYSSGTHIVRFAGLCVGRLIGCILEGNSSIDGISIPLGVGSDIELYIENCKVSDNAVGLNNTGSGATNAKIYVTDSYISGVKALNINQGKYIFSNSEFVSLDNTEYITISGEIVSINDCVFDGSKYITYHTSEYLQLHSNFFKNMIGVQDAYWLMIEKEGLYTIATNNIFSNPTKYMRFYQSGKALNNHCKVIGNDVDTTGSNA